MDHDWDILAPSLSGGRRARTSGGQSSTTAKTIGSKSMTSGGRSTTTTGGKTTIGGKSRFIGGKSMTIGGKSMTTGCKSKNTGGKALKTTGSKPRKAIGVLKSTKGLRKKPAGAVKVEDDVLVAPPCISTGSCCSGLGTDEMACHAIGVQTRPLFMVELDPDLRGFLSTNFDCDCILDDAFSTLFTDNAPRVDP